MFALVDAKLMSSVMIALGFAIPAFAILKMLWSAVSLSRRSGF